VAAERIIVSKAMMLAMSSSDKPAGNAIRTLSANDTLTEIEMQSVLDAAKRRRRGARDYLLLLMLCRHGICPTDAARLRRDQVDLQQARFWLKRKMVPRVVEHLVAGDELYAIKHYLATRADLAPWLFISESGHALSQQAVNYIVRKVGEAIGLRGLQPRHLTHTNPDINGPTRPTLVSRMAK
jgi:integrase